MYWDLPSSSSQLICLLANIVYIRFCKNSMDKVGMDKNLVVYLRWVRIQLNFEMLIPNLRTKLEMANTEYSKMALSSYFKD